MKALVIAPHFDDAVLSAGEFLAANPGSDALTIFAGVPINPIEYKYDEMSGFNSPEEAIESRKDEDANALKILKANPIYLDFPDWQYRQVVNPDKIKKAILRHLSVDNGYEIIIGPLGLRHRDHQVVGDIMFDIAFTEWGIPVYFYEDIPSRVLWPEEVFPKTRGMKMETLANGFLSSKKKALKKYKSQWNTGSLTDNLCLVPERFWKYE